MASMTLFAIFTIIVVIAIPGLVMATEYKVGDDSGWTIKFDYNAWAKDKEFVVGDKLVFSYPVGTHTVFKVNATAFQDCIFPPESEALASGNDIITLGTPGKKWYICGVGQHCKTGGQKLSINVLPGSGAPSPAPVSPSSATGIATSAYQVFCASAVVFVMIVMA